MADFNPKFVDLVRSYSTTTGTADFVLAAAVNGFTGFASALSPGDRFYYSCIGVDKPAEREVGRGTLTADGKVLREPISGAKTNFSNGTKAIALVAAAEYYGALGTRVAAAESGLAAVTGDVGELAVQVTSLDVEMTSANQAIGGLETQVAALGNAAVQAAATRAALAGLAGSSGPAILKEAGREGMFVWDSSNLSAMVTADTRQGIYVAPSSDTTGASGAWVRKFDGLASAAWWGLAYDDMTDNSPALQCAINVSKAAKLTGTQYGYGRGSFGVRIPFPAGGKALYCATQLTIDHPMHLLFDGNAGARGGSAVLRFAASQGGILLKFDAATGGAAGSHIENAMLYGGYAGSEGEYHGIEFQVACRLTNCFVSGFAGDGIYCYTGSGGTGNVNGSVIDNAFAQSCRNGFYLRGTDTNAMSLINPVAIANRRYGVWSYLTLGNAYLGGNSSTNGSIGVGGAIPFTMCTYGGNRYYVMPNQDAAASTTAPTGTTGSNAVWRYRGPGGTAPEFPAWVSGTQTFRAGGAARFEGAYEQNTLASFYVEPDQPPIQMVSFGGNLPQSIILSSLSGTAIADDGYDYGGQVIGNASGYSVKRSMTIGDMANASPAVPNALTSLSVQGDLRLSRAAGNVYDPNFYLNTTNAYATIQFQRNGTNKGVIQYYQDDGLYFVNWTKYQFYTVAGGLSWYYDATNGLRVKVGPIGYDTGAGGTVTQATSRTTGVTLNKVCGQITLVSATTAAGQVTSFTVTNSTVAASDTINLSVQSGTGVYLAFVTKVQAGSFNISVHTPAAVGTAEAPVINFAVVKGVTS